MPSFTGTGFHLEAVTQLGAAQIRVEFSQDPKVADPAASNDALHPANYTLTGSAAVLVPASCAAVSGSPQFVDLFFAGAVPAGAWILSVGPAVVAYDGTTALGAPTALPVVVEAGAVQEAVQRGAENDSCADLLRKNLNPALKGRVWDSLIAALATGDQANLDVARAAHDQLSKASAEGPYLDQRSADDGLRRPAGIGMPDELFRSYSISATNRKLVEGALLEILEAFYGADSVRAHADSGAAEPYVLQDGDDLQILFGAVLVDATFSSADFGVIGAARAAEVAAAITRAARLAGTSAYALPVTNPTAGTTEVRVYSGARGLGSSVQVLGGRAQLALQFPEVVAVYGSPPSLPTWNITYDAPSSTLTFSPTAAFDCSQLLVGDQVLVYGPEFAAGNRGTWEVTSVRWAYPGGVLQQWFEVVSASGSAQSGLAQAAQADVEVLRPGRATTLASGSRSVSVASLGSEVDVVLPATSQAVGRSPLRAAYLHSASPVQVSSVTRSGLDATFATTAPHGLAAAAEVWVDGAYGAGPGLNGPHSVAAVPDSTHFTVQTPWSYTLTAALSAAATPSRAPSGGVAGPYAYDPASPAVTAQASTTSSALGAGRRYGWVDVADASQFPDAPGWVVFAHGRAWQVGPVRYLGRLSGTRISLDYSFQFPATVPAGSDVRVVAGKVGYVPAHPEQVGSFYATASADGRVAAQQAIEDTVAAGVGLSVQVTYPGDRGLGHEGLPASGAERLSDEVVVWGGDDVDDEIAAARGE